MKEVHTLARSLMRICSAPAYVHVTVCASVFECAFVYALPRLKHNITPHLQRIMPWSVFLSFLFFCEIKVKPKY